MAASAPSTERGVARFRATGVNLSAENQRPAPGSEFFEDEDVADDEWE